MHRSLSHGVSDVRQRSDPSGAPAVGDEMQQHRGQSASPRQLRAALVERRRVERHMLRPFEVSKLRPSSCGVVDLAPLCEIIESQATVRN